MLNPATGKKWKVFVAIPTTGSVADFQPHIMREIQSRYADEVELVYPEVFCQRIFHDHARNGLVEDFLKTDCDLMWFLDSDVIPPRHILDLVTMHGDKWLCAGAPYPVFMNQPGEVFRQIVITVYKGVNNKKSALAPAAQIPFEGVEWVDGLATGCLMIKREVFSRLEKPYFEFKYDTETRQPIEGEDLGFCLKMHKLGIQFLVDYSAVCKHFKNHIDLLEMNNYCMSFAKKAVEAHHKIIKEQVENYIRTKLSPKQREVAMNKWQQDKTVLFPSI